MNTIRKALILFVAGFLCTATARAETLKIGVIAALTGGGAPWGKATVGGIRLAADEVNARGGLLVGGKRYTVNVVAYDDKYAANESVAAYNRLVKQDGVRFVLLMSSAGTMALRQNVEDDGVLALTSSYSKKALDASSKHMFRIYSTPTDYVPSLATWMREHLRERRVVILNPNDETGWDQTELCERVFKEKGFDVLGHELFERTVQDFQPVLTKLLALKPEIIEIGGTSPATAGLIVRQARELGYAGRFTKMGGAGPKDIVKTAGAKAAEGMIQMLYADPKNPGYQKIVTEYEATERGQEPNEIIVAFYDAARVLLRSIELAGTVSDTDKVAAAFNKALPMKSVQGDELRLGGKAMYGLDRQLMSTVYIGETRNGAPVVVGKAQ